MLRNVNVCILQVQGWNELPWPNKGDDSRNGAHQEIGCLHTRGPPSSWISFLSPQISSEWGRWGIRYTDPSPDWHMGRWIILISSPETLAWRRSLLEMSIDLGTLWPTDNSGGMSRDGSIWRDTQEYSMKLCDNKLSNQWSNTDYVYILREGWCFMPTVNPAWRHSHDQCGSLQGRAAEWFSTPSL